MSTLTRSQQHAQEIEEAQERIAEALKFQPLNVIQCRGLLHAWAVMNDFRILKGPANGPQFLRRDLQCTRGCGVIRHDTFLLRFIKGEPHISQKVRANYTYPEGYQIAGVPRGVKRQVIVYQEEFRRALAKAAVDLAGEPKSE